MPAPPRTPAECFATLLAWLSRAVVARRGAGQLPLPLFALIIDRIRDINQRLARLAARIREGRNTPRIVAAPHRRPATARRPNPLPQKFGWLLKLVPEAIGYRSQLEFLLRDPAMVEFMQAAPASLGRPLRSLCWMLGLDPPPVLAPPARHAACTEPQAPPPPDPAPPPSAPQKAPEPAVIPPCACGPPYPA